MIPPYDIKFLRREFELMFKNYGYEDYVTSYGRLLVITWNRIYQNNKNNKYSLLKFLRMRAEMHELKSILPHWDAECEKCQSPPELYMYDSFMRHKLDIKYGLRIVAQYPAYGGRKWPYFVDFAFIDGSSNPPPLLVEYYSKDFHSDFDKDLARAEDIDEYMILYGFTGSDFERCSKEVDSILNKYYIGRLNHLSEDSIL